MKIILVGIALVALAALVMMPYSDHNQSKLRIAYFANIGHAVPIVGIEQGLFAASLENQTSIETRVFDSGPQVIESMFANSIDLAYVGPGPAINGHLNSQNNIKILAGAASGGASFIAHPDSEFVSSLDFEDKKIAAPQIGNTQDVSLRNHLAEHEFKSAERGGSVTIYNISNPDIYTLFVKGDIDGAWVAEPWATILEAELNGTRLFFEEELWPDKKFASVLLIGNIDYIKNNPQIISDYMESHHDTVQWINKNPTETRIIFNNFLDSYLGEPLSDEIVDTALSNIEITSDPLKDSVRSFAQQADSLGYLGRGGYDLSEIYHDSNFTRQGAM